MRKNLYHMFRVSVFEKGLANCEHTQYCLGLDDVYEFIETKKKELKEDYSGYNKQSVDLSSYAKKIITKGINN